MQWLHSIKNYYWYQDTSSDDFIYVFVNNLGKWSNLLSQKLLSQNLEHRINKMLSNPINQPRNQKIGYESFVYDKWFHHELHDFDVEKYNLKQDNRNKHTTNKMKKLNAVKKSLYLKQERYGIRNQAYKRKVASKQIIRVEFLLQNNEKLD